MDMDMWLVPRTRWPPTKTLTAYHLSLSRTTTIENGWWMPPCRSLDAANTDNFLVWPQYSSIVVGGGLQLRFFGWTCVRFCFSDYVDIWFSSFYSFLVLGTKTNFQNPTLRLKIDPTSKNKENISIPPASDAKGLLGPGPAHLKLKRSKGPDAKHFTYRKCYHYGFNDHVVSKCPNVTPLKYLYLLDPNGKYV